MRRAERGGSFLLTADRRFLLSHTMLVEATAAVVLDFAVVGPYSDSWDGLLLSWSRVVVAGFIGSLFHLKQGHTPNSIETGIFVLLRPLPTATPFVSRSS